MPASERSFHGPLPLLMYLDTDFLLSLIFDDQPHHQQSQLFAERMVQANGTALVLSSLLWTEFAHTLARENFRLRLSGDLAREVAPKRWVLRHVRESYIQRYLNALDQVLTQFSFVEVPLDAAIRRAALALMARHALGSQDSVHVATAFAAGTRDLVSFDATYRRVDGLLLWNDHAAAGDAS
jgi:predicted nucleic acid-binding protein